MNFIINKCNSNYDLLSIIEKYLAKFLMVLANTIFKRNLLSKY